MTASVLPDEPVLDLRWLDLEHDDVSSELTSDALRWIVARGSFHTGTERRAIAEHARRVRGLVRGGTGPTPAVANLVARVADRAWESRPEHVQAWVDGGRHIGAYVEIVSVVSAICAVDSCTFALGEPLQPLPAAEPGAPLVELDPAASIVDSWVPTVGPGSATRALSMLPYEMGLNRLMQHGWYLDDSAIFDFASAPDSALTRAQMEFLAARTSAVNECFY